MQQSFAGLLLGTVVGLSLATTVPLNAQNLVAVHSFSAASDGSGPQGLLLSPGGRLFGTTRGGGAGGNGTIFGVNPDATGFTNLYSFSAGSGSFPYTNADGISPNALVLSGNALYGRTVQGGIWGYGTIFRLNVDGSGFTNLYQFSAAPGFGAPNDDGANPYGRLVLAGNTLFGTTSGGGHAGAGTVFKVNTDGSGFTTVNHLPGFGDAGFPLAGLVLSGATLYGTTSVGGNASAGTVFSVNTDGSGFSTLHVFSRSDGAYPQSGLVLGGATLYGTTRDGGASGIGTVFKVNTNGSQFTILHTFIGAGSPLTNSDGGILNGNLALVGNTLYGTASQGGDGGWGTLFSVSTDGTDFQMLHAFTGTSDGLFPGADLLASGTALYGTAAGGKFGAGLLFSLVVAPQLAFFAPGPSQLIVSWPTNKTGYILQRCTSLAPGQSWFPIQGVPVMNGMYTLTSSISGSQQYFRLVH